MIAPCVIAVGCNTVAACIYNTNDVALQVLQIVIFGCGAVGYMCKADGRTVLVIAEVQCVSACYVRCQQAAVVGVAVGRSTVGLARTQTSVVVRKGQRGSAVRCTAQLSAALPAVGPAVESSNVTGFP